MIVLRVWKGQPGKFFCISTKSATGEWEDHFFKKAEFNRVNAFIRDRSDREIYFCPHGFSEPRRRKQYAVLPKLLWSDMDEADPRAVRIKPTIAIESSPGRYVGLWLTDREVTEDINRRLAYFLGADRSGWDLTQVLRVPGTINHKYQSKPRVRIMWGDGDNYQLDDLLAQLPAEEKGDEQDSGIESDAAAVFKKYERKLPVWVRKELVSGRPTPGKRSEMLWKIEQVLIEKGLTTEEAFVLIKASPWNKFRGRRNEDEQLKRELDKAINHHFKASSPVAGEENDEDAPRLLFRSMAEVEEENIDWIWYPYLARGELSILEGDPGLGKSYLAQMIAKGMCDGDVLPSVKRIEPTKGIVVYFDIENSAGSVTKKRLVENGLKGLERFIQCEEPFSVDDDDTMEGVYEYLEKHRPVLVVFDTLNTYLGKADAYKSHEAQQAFVRFREIASRFNCSVLVLRHLTKSTKERALYRGQGSIAFAGLARVVMTVGVLPDDPDMRAMAVTKINVTKAPQAMTFTIEALPDTLKQSDRSRFVWGDFVDISADDMLNAPPSNSNAERDEAKDFLKDQLEDGEVEISRLEKMAEMRSISRRTLQRAADELGVVKEARGFGKEKRSFWSLSAKH